MRERTDSVARAVSCGGCLTDSNANRREVLMTSRHFILSGVLVVLVLHVADAGQTNVDLPVSTSTAGPSRNQAELPTVKPEDVGMSSEKLALVKPALQKFVDDKEVPGAIVVAARHGKVVLFESVGWRDIEAEKRMQKDSILRFYSMTKPITSASIMMLVEEGKIGLDDPVSKHVPEFDGLKVFVEKDGEELKREDTKREMSIRDLLRHTSGFTASSATHPSTRNIAPRGCLREPTRLKTPSQSCPSYRSSTSPALDSITASRQTCSATSSSASPGSDWTSFFGSASSIRSTCTTRRSTFPKKELPALPTTTVRSRTATGCA